MVYVAGPYTNPDPVINTRRAIDAGMDIYKTGAGIPLIPHLTMFVHLLHPNADVEFWYEYDLHTLERCDAVLRLEGASSGADREVAYARRLGIPVFEDGMELELWCQVWQQQRNGGG